MTNLYVIQKGFSQASIDKIAILSASKTVV